MESHCTGYAEAGGRDHVKGERQAKMETGLYENARTGLLEWVVISRARPEPIKRNMVLIKK